MNATPIVIFVAFSSIATLTWFFSYQPRLFLRIFVPSDELRGVARGILRNPDYGRGMRSIAVLQFLAAVMIGALVWWTG